MIASSLWSCSWNNIKYIWKVSLTVIQVSYSGNVISPRHFSPPYKQTIVVVFMYSYVFPFSQLCQRAHNDTSGSSVQFSPLICQYFSDGIPQYCGSILGQIYSQSEPFSSCPLHVLELISKHRYTYERYARVDSFCGGQETTVGYEEYAVWVTWCELKYGQELRSLKLKSNVLS